MGDQVSALCRARARRANSTCCRTAGPSQRLLHRARRLRREQEEGQRQPRQRPRGENACLPDDRTQRDARDALSDHGAGRAGDRVALGADELRRLRAAKRTGAARGRRRRRERRTGRRRNGRNVGSSAGRYRICARRKLGAGFLRDLRRARQDGVRDADARPLRRHASLAARPVAGRSRRQGDLPLLLRPRRAGLLRPHAAARYVDLAVAEPAADLRP